MCLAIDAAIYMSNKIIDIRNEKKDKNYVADFFKIHKLLYISQGIMLAKYNRTLFKEDITAHTCGVYVGGLDTFYEMVGIQDITTKYKDNLILLTSDRTDILDYVANNYGNVDRNELINITKQHSIYAEAYEKVEDEYPKPIICKNDLRNYFYKNKYDLYPMF